MLDSILASQARYLRRPPISPIRISIQVDYSPNMALLSSVIKFTSENILGLIVLGILIHFTRNYLTPGASAVPGPFAAKLSNIWRFVDVARGRPDKTLYNLHQKYGDYVRLGPNVVSVRNPRMS